MFSDCAVKFVALFEKSRPTPAPSPEMTMLPAITDVLTPANTMPSEPGLVMLMSPKRIAAGESVIAIADPVVFEIVVAPLTVKLPETWSSTTPDVPPFWVIESSTICAVIGSMKMPTPSSPSALLPDTWPPVMVNQPATQVPFTVMPASLLSSAFRVAKV